MCQGALFRAVCRGLSSRPGSEERASCSLQPTRGRRRAQVIGTCAAKKEAVGRATGVDELIVLDDSSGVSDFESVDVVKRVRASGELGCVWSAELAIRNTLHRPATLKTLENILNRLHYKCPAITSPPNAKHIGRAAP